MAGPTALTGFCLGATYGTLATPANLKRWGLSDDSKCELCEKENAGIQHILSGCNIALGQGRYRFRHNEVLRSLAQCLQKQLVSCKGNGRPKRVTRFVKEGEQPRTTKEKATGILQDGTTWRLLVDLDKQLIFPLVETLLRPDMVLLADKEKILVIIELTCPAEENIEARHCSKQEKYEELAQQCREAGWKTYLFAVEVGARGYAAQSVWTCWKKLGIPTKEIKITVKEVSNIALRCSFWIWLSRKTMYWTEKEVMSHERRVDKQPHQQTDDQVQQQTHKQFGKQAHGQSSQQQFNQDVPTRPSQQTNKNLCQKPKSTPTNMLKQHDQQTSKKPSGQTKTNNHSSQQPLRQSDQQPNKKPSGQTNNKSSQKTNKQSSPQTNNQSTSQQENHQSNKQTDNITPQWKQNLFKCR